MRKFVLKESDHKAPDSDSINKTSHNGKCSIDGEKLDDNFQLESDILDKKGGDDGSNDGNVENRLANLQQTNWMKQKVIIKRKKKIKPKRANNRKRNNNEKEKNDEQKSVPSEEGSKEWIREKTTENLFPISPLKKMVLL